VSVEVWIGTPNEMAKAASKDTLPAAVRWARDHLDALTKQARKYDTAAIAHIVSASEDMQRLHTIRAGETRGWEFPYIAITFRIELRRTP